MSEIPMQFKTDFLSVEDAAAELGLSHYQIERALNAGKLRYYRVGRAIARADLEQFRNLFMPSYGLKNVRPRFTVQGGQE